MCVEAVDKILKMMELAAVKQEETPRDLKDPPGHLQDPPGHLRESADVSKCLMKTTEGELRTQGAAFIQGSCTRTGFCRSTWVLHLELERQKSREGKHPLLLQLSFPVLNPSPQTPTGTCTFSIQ